MCNVYTQCLFVYCAICLRGLHSTGPQISAIHADCLYMSERVVFYVYVFVYITCLSLVQANCMVCLAPGRVYSDPCSLFVHVRQGWLFYESVSCVCMCLFGWLSIVQANCVAFAAPGRMYRLSMQLVCARTLTKIMRKC